MMSRTRIFGILCALCIVGAATAQVTTLPAIIQRDYMGEITVIFNPNEGNKGMVGAKACYAHTGISYYVDDPEKVRKWQGGPTWRSALPKHKMTQRSDGNWELKITPNMYAYYGISKDTVSVTQLCFVFNDGASGTKEGKAVGDKDIFVDVAEAGLAASIETSASEISKIGDKVTLECHASSAATMTLSLNGMVLKTAEGTSMTYAHTISAQGNNVFLLEAKTAKETATATFTTCVPSANVRANRPAGIVNGIYYDTDPTKVTLCTYAASKTQPAQRVFVVGDFNDWTISNEYQLKQANDSAYFWITIDGLTPKEEYAFQYVVVRADGVIKRISDLYSEKLLTPDDQSEPKKVDPTLKNYPKKGDGYVSVLQTGKEPYQWSDATLNFKRPNKNNLVIYELWVYDYTPGRSIPALHERLDYLQNLGVNAIELMPVTEFDGNYNWGYSPNHYFALDKAYGTPEHLKAFIDECHKRGIAVILDMVFNHATGNNPMNKLYPHTSDLAELKVNPWFNAVAPHGNNVYEDWNHDFLPTKTMFKRALQYWLKEYKIDGYRMDLAQGFCGTSKSSVETNITDYYNAVKSTSSDAYFILEYWNETGMPSQQTMVNKGMLCWGGGSGFNKAYCQTAMGWLKEGDGITDMGDGYVTYCNSHDEERPFFKAKQWGAGNLKTDIAARSHRVPLNIALNVLLNGSHMFYQYDELGYDYSKYQDENGNFGNDDEGNYGLKPAVAYGTKTGKKPRPESRGYFAAGPRMEAYQQVAQLIQLRTRLMPEVFSGNPTANSLGSGKAVRTIQWGSNVYVVGNFSATAAQDATLPAGSWYDYYAGGTAVSGGTKVTLQPGDLKIYTGKVVALPEVPSSYDFLTSVAPVFPDIKSATDACKVFRNGGIYILRDGVYYDLMGRRIGETL